ncbi:hypothetical protein AGMMS49936_10880 [Endomicrobiia bacterium]|nr:hypothetical protein AGMMS49936_10880 [Endomicrobiia bacterium]
MVHKPAQLRRPFEGKVPVSGGPDEQVEERSSGSPEAGNAGMAFNEAPGVLQQDRPGHAQEETEVLQGKGAEWEPAA